MRTSQGLLFTTSSGSKYYYDDCSGMCFPCPDGLKKTLRKLDKSAKSREFVQGKGWDRFINSRALTYNAFYNKGKSKAHPPSFSIETLKSKINQSGFRHLLLVLTEACNLRCRYCIFSENYPFARGDSTDIMSSDVALSATEYYLRKVKQIRRKNPAHPVVITFYGGEPLLNFPVMQEVIERVKSHRLKNVTFSISTNGLLLDESIGDYLVKNDVSIAVSLDGPQSVHDRNRVSGNGNGSFAKVFSNLNRFWNRHPHYPYLAFLVTYDLGTNLYEVRRFFKEDHRFRNCLFIFSQVNPNFTGYYTSFRDEQRRKFLRETREIKDCLMKPGKIFGQCDPMLDFFCGMPLYLFVKRRILLPPGREEIPATSTCLPGDKLCVMPSGEIEICERSPGLKIGSVNNGLNFETIKQIIDKYNYSITSHCDNCPVSRLCGTCFATFWSGETFRLPNADFCKTRKSLTKSILQDTWSILEENPGYFAQNEAIDHRTFRRLKALTM